MNHHTITMTYGKVPRLNDDWRRRADGFTWDLRGSDETAVCRVLGGGYDYSPDPDTLHSYVVALTDAWRDGDDDAGSLASSVLGCLGYEWV